MSISLPRLIRRLPSYREIRTEIARRAAHERGSRDPDAFIEYVMHDEKGYCVRQGVLHRLMQYHIGYAWARGQHAVIVGPPEHGKSVQMIGRMIWELGRNPNLRIAIISGNEQLAKDRLLNTRSLIIESRELREVFPNLRPAPADRLARQEWTMHRFYVERAGHSTDPSMQAAAAQGKTEGKRIDILVCDDMVTREDWASDVARKRTIEAWENTWSKRLGARGKALFLNNAWHKKDLIHGFREKSRYAVLWIGIPDSCECMEAEALHVGADYEAERFALPGTHAKGPRATFRIPLWNEEREGQVIGWTRERLLQEFEENRIVARRMFGGKAIDLGSMTFAPFEQWAKYADASQIPGIATAPVAGFLDPATGKGKGDFSAIAAAALGSDGRTYLLDMWMSQTAKPTEQIARIFDMHQAIGDIPGRGGRGFHAFGIETNVFAELLKIPFAQEMEKRRQANQRWQVPMKGIEVRDKKEARILTLQPPMERGWLVAPEDGARRWPTLFEQLEGYGPESTPAHDDGPDALASALEMLRSVPVLGKDSSKGAGIRSAVEIGRRF